MITEDKLALFVPSKRGIYDIMAQILSTIQAQPMKKSHISFKSNLDSRAVTKYLIFMKKSNLLKTSFGNPPSYSITERGVKYLDKYQQLLKFITS